MLTCRFVFSAVLKSFLLMLNTAASAQSAPGQWVCDKFLFKVISETQSDIWILLDEKDNVQTIIPNVKNAIDFPVPFQFRQESWRAYWHNGALYTLAYGVRENNEDGTEFRRWTFASWQDGKWCFLGEYIAEPDELFEAIPCDNNHFIVVSLRNDITDNKLNPTPFARMSVHPDKKKLRLDSSIDHGQEEIRKYMSIPSCFELAWYSNIIMTDTHATLLNYDTGLYWIFSLEKASLARAGNIFKKVTPEMIAEGGFIYAILGANPEKAGTILIAAQEEDLLIKANDPYIQMHKFQEEFQATDEEAREMFLYYYKEHLDRSPFVVWYRIYPDSGKVEKLKGHPEGGTWLRDDLKHNTWRPMPDGSVKINWNEMEIVTRLNK